jgi:hypothetical protein
MSDYAKALENNRRINQEIIEDRAVILQERQSQTMNLGRALSVGAMLITSSSILAGGLFFWVDKVNALEVEIRLQGQRMDTYESNSARLEINQKETRSRVEQVYSKITDLEVNGRANSDKLDIILDLMKGSQ